jgi:hypothetical protein
MLKTISWGQFAEVMVPLIMVYYMAVLLKCYRWELKAFLTGRKFLQKDGATKSSTAQAKVVDKPNGQGSLFGGHETIGLIEGNDGRIGGGGSQEMFKVMDRVVGLLKEIVTKGASVGMGKDDLLMEVGDVLSRFHQLKGTPYQTTINGFLVRTCSSNFSLALSEADLVALWD